VLGRNNDELNKAAKRVMMMLIAERGNQNGAKGRGAIFDVTTTTTPMSPPRRRQRHARCNYNKVDGEGQTRRKGREGHNK